MTGLNPASVQGDRFFLSALVKMGCQVTVRHDSVMIEHEGPLTGITIDMSSAPDTVQTLCMVAAVAKTPTVITGIGHLKYKESDRIAVTAERLRQLGATVNTHDDRIIIRPAPLHGGTIDPANDHRMAMSSPSLASGSAGSRSPARNASPNPSPVSGTHFRGDGMRRIVLFGYRGTGKTAIGTVLARRLECPSSIPMPSSNRRAAARSPKYSAMTGRSGSGNGNAT